MAVPAIIGDAHIGMALVTELGLVFVTIHARSGQTHVIRFLVTRVVYPCTITDDRGFPVFQEILVIDTDKGLRFDALLFVCRNFGFGYIAHLSTRRIIPERSGYQTQENH